MTLFRVSRIGWPVLINAFSTSFTDAVGFCCLSTAHAPATCGAAIDVPSRVENVPPGIDDVITSPGAHSVSSGLEFENDETRSAGPNPGVPSVVDPTLMAVDTQAGDDSALMKPLLPAATTVAMPADRS